MTPVHRLAIALTILFHATALHAQSRSHGIWVGAGFGYGSLSRSTSELSDDRHDTFTGRFSGGYNVSSHLRLGVEIGGWAIEMFDFNDPSKGEGVSNLFAVAEVYPWSGKAFFLKSGGGLAFYSNSHQAPAEAGGTGPGLVLGAGYDLRLGGKTSLTLNTQWTQGHFSDDTNPLHPVHDRQFHVLDVTLGLTYR